MVGPGREPYPDPVAVGFEPAFHGWPEQRVGPRDIPAEHQHVGAEAFRPGGCECRQPLPVFVEREQRALRELGREPQQQQRVQRQQGCAPGFGGIP